MPASDPIVEVHPRFSSPDAIGIPWMRARQVLEAAEIYWLSTVRPDGRPHVTPLIAVWIDGALNPSATLTTGTNDLGSGLDVVVEGEVERVVDHGALERVASAYAAKYPPTFHFQVADAGLDGAGGGALVFRLVARTGFAFARGAVFSQTRYRFEEEAL